MGGVGAPQEEAQKQAQRPRYPISATPLVESEQAHRIKACGHGVEASLNLKASLCVHGRRTYNVAELYGNRLVTL